MIIIMKQIRSNGCKHLDYNSRYSANKKRDPKGFAYQIRQDFYEKNQDKLKVQYCRKHGILKGSECCTQHKYAKCNEYKEHVHVVEVEDREFIDKDTKWYIDRTSYKKKYPKQEDVEESYENPDECE